MNRVYRLLIAILLAALSAKAQQAPAGGRVEGVVVDSVTGRPLAGAMVSVVDEFVSRDGTFSFSGLSPGRYDVQLLGIPADHYLVSARQGERDAMTDGILIQAEQAETRPVEIVAASGAVPLSGKVVDA
jgi:hypothetical protein